MNLKNEALRNLTKLYFRLSMYFLAIIQITSDSKLENEDSMKLSVSIQH